MPNRPRSSHCPMEPPTVQICRTPHFDRTRQKVERRRRCKTGGGANISNCSDKAATARILHHKLWRPRTDAELIIKIQLMLCFPPFDLQYKDCGCVCRNVENDQRLEADYSGRNVLKRILLLNLSPNKSTIILTKPLKFTKIPRNHRRKPQIEKC